MKTYIPKQEEIEHKWYLVDAKGKVLGRLAVSIAEILSGKNKPMYTPHLDTGDFVVVINAEHVHVTGGKEEQKLYHHYSGYPGGMKSHPFKDMIKRRPERVITQAVHGMLPKTKLGRKMISKLKVYPGDKHPHQGQNPQPIDL